jgi:syntaxin 16
MKKQQEHGDAGQHLLRNSSGSEALIGAVGGPTSPSISRSAEAPSLPPQWVDFSDKAREDLKETEAQLVKLIKAQQKRLLRPFDAGVSVESEIQALTASIGDLIRSCENSIFRVRTAGQGVDSAMDDEFRHNVQRSLAAQLTQVSMATRKAQKDYLREMGRRHNPQQQQQQTSYDVESGRPSNGDDGGSAVRMEWLQQQEDMEETAAIRSGEISQIAASVTELHQIFKDMANLVIEQGSILDRIDFNTEKVYKKVDDGKTKIVKALEKKKDNDSRVMKCFIGWAVADLIMIIALLVKYQYKYGLINVFWFLCIIAVPCAGCVWYARRQKPAWLSPDYWSKKMPDLDPKAMWKRIRPGPVNMAKAAATAARARRGG